MTISDEQAVDAKGLAKDLDQFCAKTTTLIECLLPQLVEETNEVEEAQSLKSEDAVSDLSKIIQLDQQMLGPGQPTQAARKKAARKQKLSDSPLHLYIVNKKRAIIKLAVNKLSATLK